MKIKKIEGSNGRARVVAVEGLNGVGKSTLVRAYSKRHPEVCSGYSVPEVYLADPALKKYILFRACPIASALYYIGALADSRRKMQKEASSGRILSDRSIWSTIAAAYAKDPSCLMPLLETVEALKADLVLPDTVVVLKGSYETCQARIGSKKSGAEFDADSRLVFERKYEVYDALKNGGYDVRFIETDGKSPEEVLLEFEALPIWGAAA